MIHTTTSNNNNMELKVNICIKVVSRNSTNSQMPRSCSCASLWIEKKNSTQKNWKLFSVSASSTSSSSVIAVVVCSRVFSATYFRLTMPFLSLLYMKYMRIEFLYIFTSTAALLYIFFFEKYKLGLHNCSSSPLISHPHRVCKSSGMLERLIIVSNTRWKIMFLFQKGNWPIARRE